MAIWILQPDADGNCCDCTDRVEPCDSCEPISFSCYLEIPEEASGLSVTPHLYDTIVDAQQALDDRAGGCYTFECVGVDDLGTITSSLTDETLTITKSVTSEAPFSILISKFICNVGTFSVSFSINFTGGWSGSQNLTINILDSNGSIIDTQTFSNGTSFLGGTANFDIDLEGLYYVQLFCGGGIAAPPATLDASFVLSSSVSIAYSPLVALWDDSGTTRQLEACPKNIIPSPFRSDSWFFNLTQAANYLASSYVASCNAWIDNIDSNVYGTVNSFTCTPSPFSFSMSLTSAFDGFDLSFTTADVIAAFRLESGTTLSCSLVISTTLGGASLGVNASIYDIDGTLVDSYTTSGGGTGTYPFSLNVPYDGTFQVLFNFPVSRVTPATFTSTMTCSATFDGSITTCPVQALYDLGLDCPARLDCS